MFITFGDIFLPSPTSYDELYYEIIRMSQLFDNLHAVGKLVQYFSPIAGSWVFDVKSFSGFPLSGKVGNVVKAFPDREKCVIVLIKHGKRFGKNSVLHHLETNAIGAEKY